MMSSPVRICHYRSYLDRRIDSVSHMTGIVPQPDHRLGYRPVFIAEHTYARCVQHEKSPSGGFEPKQRGSEHSQKNAHSKKSAHPFDRAHSDSQRDRPRADVIRHFSHGNSHRETNCQSGTLPYMDLDRSGDLRNPP